MRLAAGPGCRCANSAPDPTPALRACLGLQVDCLSGMGAMYRDNGQLRAAEGFMRQALRCAEALGDDVVRASCLTHLGSVLIASDAGAAIKHLEEAVQLREDQVRPARRCCCPGG